MGPVVTLMRKYWAAVAGDDDDLMPLSQSMPVHHLRGAVVVVVLVASVSYGLLTFLLMSLVDRILSS